jgi:hypothetical protein
MGRFFKPCFRAPRMGTNAPWAVKALADLQFQFYPVTGFNQPEFRQKNLGQKNNAKTWPLIFLPTIFLLISYPTRPSMPTQSRAPGTLANCG